MGVEYLSSQEIKAKKYSIKPKMQKLNEFLQEGVTQEVIETYLPKKEAVVVELGCSSGKTLELFSSLGYKNLWGVDIDDYLVGNEFKDRLLIADLNSERIPRLQDNSVDAIFAFQILEHLENPLHFARECARLLKKDGLLVISMPSGNSIFDKISFFLFGNLTAYTSHNNHITFLLDKVFNKAFRDFEIIKMKYGWGYLPHLKPRRLNKLFPRIKMFSYNKMYIMRRK